MLMMRPKETGRVGLSKKPFSPEGEKRQNPF